MTAKLGHRASNSKHIFFTTTLKNSEHESICVVKRGDKEYWSDASGTWVKDTRLATTFHSTIAEIRAATLMRVTHVPCRAVEIISNKQYTRTN